MACLNVCECVDVNECGWVNLLAGRRVKICECVCVNVSGCVNLCAGPFLNVFECVCVNDSACMNSWIWKRFFWIL